MELLAIELALKVFLKDFNKKYVRIFSDNTTAVTYINKQGGIKSLSYNELAKKIWEFCIDKLLFKQPIYQGNIKF